MTLETVTFILPAHWASPLINGDVSGMSDDDEAALDCFVSDFVDRFGFCQCADATTDDDEQHPGFVTYHDARPYAPYAADCAQFTFLV